MDVSSVAAASTANALAQVQQQASVSALRQALDIQEQSAMQLVQAIPLPQPIPVGTTGGLIDTWA